MIESTEHVRWLQSALNQVLRLQLPLNGVVGPETRSAIRSFQERNGLPADGFAGPDTVQALAAARRSGLPGGADGTPAPTATPPGPVAIPAPGSPAGQAGEYWLGEVGMPLAQPRPNNRTRRSGTQATRQQIQYITDFSGPSAECVTALRIAGKTKAEALAIINAQIGEAIAMLRKAASDLKRGRSSRTQGLFLNIFRVRPEFVPTWLKPTATIKDRGDVVATRCERVAELLASGRIKYFCTINSINCPDCSNDPSDFACSSWGDESVAPERSNVICLGNAFWNDMRAGKASSLLATLMHEPFHIYFGKYVTGHRSDAGKFGGINCLVQYVFETNGRRAPDRVKQRCQSMAVRR